MSYLIGAVPEGPNVALTDTAALIVTVQDPVPVQPPPSHPVNTCALPGEAVRATGAPPVCGAEQGPGQLMPPPLMGPAPVPFGVTGRAIPGPPLGRLQTNRAAPS